MGISKEERKAYEDGREEAKYIREHPVSYSASGGIKGRPSDPAEAAAYDKGLAEEQFDEE